MGKQKSMGKKKSPRRDSRKSSKDVSTLSSNRSNTSSSSSRSSKSNKVAVTKKVTLAFGNYRSEYTVQQLREIERLQKLATLIPKLPFSRVIKETMQQYGEFRVTAEALVGLQEAAELYLTHFYEDSNKCCLHAKRVTLKPIDMQLIADLRRPYDKVGVP